MDSLWKCFSEYMLRMLSVPLCDVSFSTPYSCRCCFWFVAGSSFWFRLVSSGFDASPAQNILEDLNHRSHRAYPYEAYIYISN